MAAISIRDVRKRYQKTEILHGVDLEFAHGEFVVILGPSGCGKSTLLRMIAGLEEISSGEIAIGGTVVNKLEPRERGCAMVFQTYALYPHMTVAENIGYALRVAGVPKAERMAKIRAVAELVELGDYLDRRPAQLSGGQRQRVAMGRAIIREPKVFLFDEPLSNLDAKLRVSMRVQIRKLHKRLDATSIFVTHDQVEAMTLADRMVVMNAGHVEQIGTPAEVYNHPMTRFVGGFLGSPPMNFLAGAEAEGGFVTERGKRRIALEAPLAAAGRGRALHLGVRPEAVSLVDPATEGALSATVDFIEELGAGRVLHTDLDGEVFAVATAGTVDHRPGDRVGLAIPATAAHLFDAGTGRRVDPA